MFLLHAPQAEAQESGTVVPAIFVGEEHEAIRLLATNPAVCSMPLSAWDVVAWARKCEDPEVLASARAYALWDIWDERVWEIVSGAPGGKPGDRTSWMGEDDVLGLWRRVGRNNLPEPAPEEARFLPEEDGVPEIPDLPGDPERFVAFLLAIEQECKRNDWHREIAALIRKSGAYQPEPGSTTQLVWEDEPGDRSQTSPALLLQRGDEFLHFAGCGRLGWVRVDKQVPHRNGKWSYSDYHLSLAPRVRVWRVDRGKFIEAPNGETIRYGGLAMWADVPAWCPQAVIRMLCPKTAQRLDANEEAP